MINVGTSIGRKSAKQRKTPVQEKKIAAIVDKLTPEEGLFPEEVTSDWISWELSNVGGFF